MIYTIHPSRKGVYNKADAQVYLRVFEWFELSTSNYRNNYHKLQAIWKEKIEMDIEHGLLPDRAINWCVNLKRL